MIPILSVSFHNNTIYLYDNYKNSYSRITFLQLNNILSKHQVLLCNKYDYFLLDKINNYENIYDVLELFLLVYPSAVCSPTTLGIYNYLFPNDKFIKPDDIDDLMKLEVKILTDIVYKLKQDIKSLNMLSKLHLLELSKYAKQDGWLFADFIEDCLQDISSLTSKKNISIFKLEEVLDEYKSEEFESNLEVEGDVVEIHEIDIEKKLQQATSMFKELREMQVIYAKNMQHLFLNTDKQNILLAEAGTGTGKTIGYLSTILAFLEKNPKQQVLISTYSKALQKQIYNDLVFLSTKTDLKVPKFADIKGSNNYACLLNYYSILSNPKLLNLSKIQIALLTRWLANSYSGDLIGGDLSPIFLEVMPKSALSFLTNNKEECLYSRCKFYKNCFIMKAKYHARNSNIVISNHAYSLLNKGLGIKYAIFDEAHHLFSVADDIYADQLSILAGLQLKNWLCGSNNILKTTKKELNGFNARLTMYIKNFKSLSEEEDKINIIISSLLESLVVSVDILPSGLALQRLCNNIPQGSFEEFLHQVYLHVLRKSDDTKQYYSQESKVHNEDLSEDFLYSVGKLLKDLHNILRIASKLYNALQDKILFLEDDEKKGCEELTNIFDNYVIGKISSYINMLMEIEEAGSEFIYRFIIEKEDGKIININYAKNYIDPSFPLATNVISSFNGIALTSATMGGENMLNNQSKVVDSENNLQWFSKFGLSYLQESDIKSICVPSPFNYKEQADIFLINLQGEAQLALGILSLFKASKGGGLALFTAITRLKKVYSSIHENLLQDNIKLFAQHINQNKLVNLIDMFKEDHNSCLLGTDSARDGINIPGNSLRLVIFEKIPWLKTDILLKARVNKFGKQYAEEEVRLKLRQSFGRLIRSNEDKGIFIILDKALPSKFINAFPTGIVIKNIPLELAISKVQQFFSI